MKELDVSITIKANGTLEEIKAKLVKELEDALDSIQEGDELGTYFGNDFTMEVT